MRVDGLRNVPSCIKDTSALSMNPAIWDIDGRPSA